MDALIRYQRPRDHLLRFVNRASDLYEDSHGKIMILESVIKCPHCAASKAEAMPTDACQFFYECSGCKTLLRPKPGDCCVFCSYGSVPCPPVQEARSDCCSKSD